MVLYPGQPGWVGTRTLRNIHPTCHLRCLQIPHYDSKPSLPVYLQSQNSWKKHEEPEPKDTLPHFLYTRLTLDLMRSLVNHWSHLTHTSHFMTTSRHTEQMSVRVSPAMQPEVFLCEMPFVLQPSLFPGLETSSEYAGWHVLRLAYIKHKQWSINWS